MDLIDKLRRYFVGNRAPILSVRRLRLTPIAFTPCHTGNSGGFYWGRWQVTWRKPFADCWSYDHNARQWMPFP